MAILRKHWIVCFKMVCAYKNNKMVCALYLNKNYWKLVLLNFPFTFLNIFLYQYILSSLVLLKRSIFLFWILIGINASDKTFSVGLSSSLHIVFIPVHTSQQRSGTDLAWSPCLYCGTNADHLFFHSRCLQDNEWNYTRAGQVFTMLKVRSGNH